VHLLAAFNPASGVVLGQSRSGGRSTRSPRSPRCSTDRPDEGAADRGRAAHPKPRLDWSDRALFDADPTPAPNAARTPPGHPDYGPAVASPPGGQEVDLPEPLRPPIRGGTRDDLDVRRGLIVGLHQPSGPRSRGRRRPFPRPPADGGATLGRGRPADPGSLAGGCGTASSARSASAFAIPSPPLAPRDDDRDAASGPRRRVRHDEPDVLLDTSCASTDRRRSGSASREPERATPVKSLPEKTSTRRCNPERHTGGSS
jgi:hypothetical protein